MRKDTRFKYLIIAILVGLIMILAACNDEGTDNEGEATEGDKSLRILSNVVGGKTPEENELFVEEIERLTDIKVELVKPPADYDQKLLTAMSSGEKFDLVLLTKNLMDILVDQGVLTEISDQIAESDILSDTTVIPEKEWDLIEYEDGNYYGVFNKFEGGTMPIVRQDWMEKLNLQQPETLEDFYNVFKAFKEQDPDGNGKDDTYGLSTAGLYDIQGFLSAEGVKYKYVYNEEGERTIPIASEAAVPVLEWFAKLYEEGLLDPNFATNETSQMRELFLTDRVGMVTYWDAWVGLFNNIRLEDDPNTEFKAKGIPGAVGPEGDIILRRGDPSLWAIPVNAESPGVAKEFLEFWHSEKGNVLSTLGIEGHDYTLTDGKYELTEIGKEHSMDHGVVVPNNTNWENPIGSLPGVEEAQEIILEHATLETSTEDWPEAEKIVQNYAFKAMMGEIPAKEAVNKMHEELMDAGLIDY
ncbi:extracellular solute-binding protein [Virgibacillus litoralis]|uniref:Aldouronate transport system substrate-binding protein n=1 Tax=Virgibacillus litoralis TaxID=578221 RepID=A0ABS4HAI1_9BACI|nr:extracellular solute-binding protein [Virgibacillus litoralis]MBP1947883.1 putative aldouronate transport system substrate-binding protein [Virgibacillus litoralis]